MLGAPEPSECRKCGEATDDPIPVGDHDEAIYCPTCYFSGPPPF